MTEMTDGQLRVLELLSDRIAPATTRTISLQLGYGALRSAASLARRGLAVRQNRRVGSYPVVTFAITEAGQYALLDQKGLVTSSYDRAIEA